MSPGNKLGLLNATHLISIHKWCTSCMAIYIVTLCALFDEERSEMERKKSWIGDHSLCALLDAHAAHPASARAISLYFLFQFIGSHTAFIRRNRRISIFYILSRHLAIHIRYLTEWDTDIIIGCGTQTHTHAPCGKGQRYMNRYSRIWVMHTLTHSYIYNNRLIYVLLLAHIYMTNARCARIIWCDGVRAPMTFRRWLILVKWIQAKWDDNNNTRK